MPTVSNSYKKLPITIKAAIVGAVVAAVLTGIFGIIIAVISRPNVTVVLPTTTPSPPPTPTPPEEDAIYQDGEIVARVSGVIVDEPNATIQFTEVYQAEQLDLEAEFEFQEWRLQFHSADAMIGLDAQQPSKGRIYQKMTCNIIGPRSP